MSKLKEFTPQEGNIPLQPGSVGTVIREFLKTISGAKKILITAREIANGDGPQDFVDFSAAGSEIVITSVTGGDFAASASNEVLTSTRAGGGYKISSSSMNSLATPEAAASAAYSDPARTTFSSVFDLPIRLRLSSSFRDDVNQDLVDDVCGVLVDQQNEQLVLVSLDDAATTVAGAQKLMEFELEGVTGTQFGE